MSLIQPQTNEDITEIYHKYVKTIYTICFIMTNNAAEAEDAVQTVFIKLIKAHKTFNSDEHLKAWLIVTARNTCRDILKSPRISKRAEFDNSDAVSYTNDNEHIDVYEKVMALSAKYKILIFLYYYKGYSTFEISKMLKINHATVRTRIRKARENLKIMIEEDM